MCVGALILTAVLSFEDVTDYCCAAVGGSYNATFRAVNVSEEQALALNHPICVTSNYADSKWQTLAAHILLC